MANDPILANRLPAQTSIVLPGYYVNVFIQAKRPTFVSRRHPANVGLWDRWQMPYFRIDLDDTQQGRLVGLERDLAGLGLVRYGAPCFWTWADLSTSVSARIVTDRTHFQSPGRIGNHSVYTYGTPSGRGWAFSEPEEVAGPSYWEDLRAAVFEVRPRSLVRVVARLWRREIEQDFGERSGLFSMAAEREALRVFMGYRFNLPLEVGPWLNPRDRQFLHDLSRAKEPTLGDFVASILRLERHYYESYRCRWSLAVPW